MRWRTEHTTVLALAVALLFPAATIWVAFRAAESLGRANQVLTGNERVAYNLQLIEAEFFSATTDQRDYIGHPDPARLAAYNSDLNAIRAGVAQLDPITSAPSVRRANFLLLRQRVAAELAIMDRVMRLQSAGRSADAFALADSAASLQAGNAVRSQIAAMADYEQRRLAGRRAAAAHNESVWLLRFSSGGLASLAVLLAGFVWLVFEVRRRRRMQEELSESNLQLQRSYERYNRLIEHIPSAVWSLRQGGIFEYASPRIAEITGFSPEQVLSSRPAFWLERLHPDELPAIQEAFSRFFEGAGSLHIEFRLRHASGEWVWLQVQALHVTGPAGQRLADGVVFDVTSRRQLEQAERLRREAELHSRETAAANRLKTEFLASVSHELRTPLTAILGFSDLMLQGVGGPLLEEQMGFVEQIHGAGNHLLSLVTDILDLARLEAGEMQFAPEVVPIEPICSEAMQTVSNQADRKRIQLKLGIEPGLEAWGDPLRIRQILINLLSNAVKFTHEGGRVGLSAHTAGEVAEFTVEDTGIGIAPEHLQTIFERFQQVAETSSPREGSGLGLAITRQLVAMHHGRIWVESELGRGAKFHFTVPLRAPRGGNAEYSSGVTAGRRDG